MLTPQTSLATANLRWCDDEIRSQVFTYGRIVEVLYVLRVWEVLQITTTLNNINIVKNNRMVITLPMTAMKITYIMISIADPSNPLPGGYYTYTCVMVENCIDLGKFSS